ncbi:MAG: VWA domain-containing protein [Candidatus Cloacimonetes bacterium]|nr:VWA domain-containing protein [Candidatus Cloacimonadota bacterium]
MKKLGLCCCFIGAVLLLNAAGVMLNIHNSLYQPAHLDSCSYEVEITNQVAEVKVTETFTNLSSSLFFPRYYFPMPRGASATKLRWNYGQQWHQASIIGMPSHPGGGPSNFPDEYIVYMQLMPLVFDPPDSLHTGEEVTMELTYVQLLNYNFGSVTLNLKNDYRLIQTAPVTKQSLSINVNSDKQILDFDILDIAAQTSHTDHSAQGNYTRYNAMAASNYRCVLQLSTDILSSWGLSTFQSSTPDDGAPGYFLYSLEEENLPADTLFSARLNIVIDVSGSMSYENRLINAKAAACYVINHLQVNDMFNVILFDHLVRPLWDGLRSNTSYNRSLALNYINDYQMPSLNGTNLYGGMQRAINQFVPVPAGVRNCVLLLSDGLPTVGITDPYQIINNINSQIANNFTDPIIHCFGVGSEVHYQLLAALAQNHHGAAVFLESSEIVNTITTFYDEMRNPILGNPTLSVTPSASVTEVLPYPFPAIYGGIQYRLVGRYYTPQNINIAVSGHHSGLPQNYNYNLNLQSVADTTNSFVPKVWAAAKIDQLVVEYYSYYPNSPEAIALRQQIIDLSIGYGVVCVFTSFSSDPPIEVIDENEVIPPLAIKLLPNIPNPFNPRTTIRFEVLEDLHEDAELRIYNLKGQLVCVKKISVNGKGLYEIEWDGTDLNGKGVGSGIYVYRINYGKYTVTAKMTMMK